MANDTKIAIKICRYMTRSKKEDCAHHDCAGANSVAYRGCVRGNYWDTSL